MTENKNDYKVIMERIEREPFFQKKDNPFTVIATDSLVLAKDAHQSINNMVELMETLLKYRPDLPWKNIEDWYKDYFQEYFSENQCGEDSDSINKYYSELLNQETASSIFFQEAENMIMDSLASDETSDHVLVAEGVAHIRELQSSCAGTLDLLGDSEERNEVKDHLVKAYNDAIKVVKNKEISELADYNKSCENIFFKSLNQEEKIEKISKLEYKCAQIAGCDSNLIELLDELLKVYYLIEITVNDNSNYNKWVSWDCVTPEIANYENICDGFMAISRSEVDDIETAIKYAKDLLSEYEGYLNEADDKNRWNIILQHNGKNVFVFDNYFSGNFYNTLDSLRFQLRKLLNDTEDLTPKEVSIFLDLVSKNNNIKEVVFA